MKTIDFLLALAIAIIGGLLTVGYYMSIEEVTITSLPATLMCETDPLFEQYLCYQP